MKKRILWVIRKCKALTIRWKLHVLFEPFSGLFMLAAYTSKMSKFLNRMKKPEFNDFYSFRYDYDRRTSLYEHVIRSEKLETVTYLEFGVSQGHSLKWWLARIRDEKSRFFGFDTFTGLPEKWGLFGKGAMSVDGQPLDIADDRCELIKGLFQETLGDFLKKHDLSGRKVIHLDADMYSSTLFVLTRLAPVLKKDDILIFDEFTVPMHEFKAFTEFIHSYYISCEMIGAVNNYFQVAFRIQ
jgi:O-methyltransferase